MYTFFLCEYSSWALHYVRWQSAGVLVFFFFLTVFCLVFSLRFVAVALQAISLPVGVRDYTPHFLT